MQSARLSDSHHLTLRHMGIDIWVSRGAQPAEPQQPPPKKPRIAKKNIEVKVEKPPPPAPIKPIAKVAGVTLPDLQKMVSQCNNCNLHTTRTQTVFGAGKTPADWMFVGEAPGQNEDLEGEPFVGRAGKLLNLIFTALGLQREQVFISNVLKCRPPANRDPKPEEIVQCEPYLLRQLELVKPKVIIALGRISAQSLLKTEQPLAKLRGQVHHYSEYKIPLVVTYHPAYLLRSPAQKAKAWEDLWTAKKLIG